MISHQLIQQAFFIARIIHIHIIIDKHKLSPFDLPFFIYELSQYIMSVNILYNIPYEMFMHLSNTHDMHQ